MGSLMAAHFWPSFPLHEGGQYRILLLWMDFHFIWKSVKAVFPVIKFTIVKEKNTS
jgi:hypothetical protein